MKKVIIYSCLVIVFSILGLFVGSSLSSSDVKQTLQQTANEVVPDVQQQEEVKVPGKPQRFVVEKLGIDTTVESVGMDAQGNMGVPENEDNVAWYNLGYHPGQQGSAVIAGHFDKRTGAPAVFYNLRNLQAGDRIHVTDDQGETYTYAVTHTQSYAFDSLPLNEIFASSDKKRLNLITCDGVFNQSSRNYSNRFVVYSELVE